MRLGRVTTRSPLTVTLQGDLLAAPADGPTTLPVGSEVLVDTVESRRFVVWAAAQEHGRAAARHAQAGLSGGGLVTWTGTLLKWTARFITISAGRGPHWNSLGYYQVLPPTVGTVIPGYGGAAPYTVTTTGTVELTDWQALYVVREANTVASLARVSYDSDFVVPEDWLLLAVRNQDEGGTLRLGDGRKLLGWTPVAFVNSWTDYGGGFPAAAYRLDSEGYVHLKGLIKSGASGTTAFTLPVGYRPEGGMHFPVMSNNQLAFLRLLGSNEPSAGAVQPSNVTAGSNVTTWTDLGGASPFIGT